jgi:hypothetical protein
MEIILKTTLSLHMEDYTALYNDLCHVLMLHETIPPPEAGSNKLNEV